MALHIINFRYRDSAASRLDEYLRVQLPPELIRLSLDPAISKSKIRRLIVAGAVSVNGRQERHAERELCKGSTVLVRFDTEKFSFEKKPDDIAFDLTERDVLFEDECLLVVNKPAGFPVEATIVGSRDHLHAAVKRFLALRLRQANEPYAGLHHRLDRETSGVILFSKTRSVNAAVHAMFLEHLAQKQYRALVVHPAKLPAKTFSVDNFMDRISAKSAAGKWGAVSSGGEHAHTDFRLLAEYKRALDILALPLTGRTHQIRVHLAALGMPLLGDRLYGGPANLPNLAIPRVMLHAASLTFPHPVGGRDITVEAPLPQDFLECLRALQK